MLEAQVHRMLGRPARGIAGHQFRLPVAERARHGHASIPIRCCIRTSTPDLRAAFRDGDGAVRRQHPARGPQRAGSADRATTPSSMRRLALHYGIAERARRPVPRGDAHRSEPLGPAGQGRGADGDLLRQPHLAGAARRLDSGEHHGHAAGRAAAERGAFKENEAGRGSRTRCASAWRASRRIRLQRLPRHHGSAGLRAGEFRRVGEWRDQGPRCRHAPSTPPASWWTARR